jgi:IBR domain, a half RING-finger domain/RNA recognition motif. (a.k.a. RRM, RBD, or RNP domain)/Zinc finger, C3HC4 type (RING finger)
MLHRNAVAASMTAVKSDPSVITSTGNNTYPAAPPPSSSQTKNPSTIPGTHAETYPSRRRQPQPPPPKLHEQTVPPKPQESTMPSKSHEPTAPPKPQEHMPASRPPLGEIQLSVMESTNVKFSGGFAIEKITTAFESLWFVIEDVPRSVGPDQVKRLAAPFGSVQEVRFYEKSSNDSVSRIFSVQMASYREVVRAVDGLDGKDVFGRRITVHLSLGKTRSQRMLRDNYVRVSWPVPCKAGYAGYSTLEAAQKAVAKADGKTERGYWITASMYQSIPIIDAYNVRFSGLPPWAGREFLDKFGPSEGTMLERPNYQAPEFGEPAVRRTLASFGKMLHFQVVPPPHKDGTVRAWCLFESPDVANSVCELNRVPQRSLNMAKISVKRVLSVLEHLPRSTFKLVEKDLHDLQQKVWNHSRGAHLEIHSRREGDKVPLKLVAEDSKTLAGLRVELKEILDGEILKEHGQQVWDNFLRHETGTHFLDDLRGCNPDVLILCHSVRRCIRLIGTAERRQPVAAAILDKLSSLRQHKTHVIPLDGQEMGVLGSPDLAAAQQRHGEESIRIDYQGHAICVRGPDSLHEEVQQIVQTVKLRHATGSGDDSCPVCLEPPLTPVSLSCGHKWCKACFVSYLAAAADTRSFPIGCLGNQGKCKELVPMKMAQEILPPADFDALALAAFHTYVQARPADYHYCPTPDCPQAYPNGPRNAPLSCPSCLARICPSCHVEYHEGVTCADREDGGDRLFKEWMRSHDVKKCPGCTAPIERAAGCNHMTCTRCRTHTCWVCLQTFPEGQGIYDHMREFHGGIGL